MADSYQDFLNLAKSLNIDLSGGVNNIAPQLTDANPKTVMPEAAKEIAGNINNDTFLTPEAQEELDDFLGFLFPKTEAGKQRAEEKAIERMGKLDAKDYLAKQKSMADMNEYLAGVAALQSMGEADAADYLAKQESFSKIPRDDEELNNEDSNVGSADEGVTIPEEEEDERPKGLKDYLKDIMSDGDALIALGGALARGEGLVGGLEDFSEARKATKALEREIAEQEFERARQAKLDEYTIATAISDIAYKQSQLTTDEVKNAQNAAYFEALAEQINPDDPNISAEDMRRYYEILNKKMDMIINKEKPMTIGTLADQIAMGAVTGNETTAGAAGQDNNQITESYTEYTQ